MYVSFLQGQVATYPYNGRRENNPNRYPNDNLKFVNIKRLFMQISKLDVFVDAWCPMCTKFGKSIEKLDVLNLIRTEDIRTSEVPSQEFRNKGLKAIASIKDNGKIYFGFDSILQISIRIPAFWLLVPALYILKITRIGDFLYSELAMKRTIIPLHCDQDCEAD